MKVILLSDVKTLGSRGTVVDVAEGYANNFLLPRGLAAEASKGAMAQLEQQNKAKAKRDAEAAKRFFRRALAAASVRFMCWACGGASAIRNTMRAVSGSSFQRSGMASSRPLCIASG